MTQIRLTAFLLVSVIFAVPAQAQAPKNVGTSEDSDNEQSIFSLEKLELDPSFEGKAHREYIDAFPVHKDGTNYDRASEDYLQIRLGLKARYVFETNVFLKFNYEHDLISRRIAGGELTEANAFVRTYGSTPETQALRELNLEFRYQAVALSTGPTVSNWGLGLLANSGRQGWTSKSAYFGSPYGGDRVFRTRAVVGPIPALKHLLFLVAYDDVIDDDILVDEDSAHQLITALVLQPGQKNTAGMYMAMRTQEHANDKVTKVTAYDVFGQYAKTLGKNTTLSVAAEAAFIVGDTDLGPNPTFAKHDIMQAGALIRTKLSHRKVGLIGDILYASGDQNTDDDQINNFRVDPNLESGLILYRHVLTASTGHSPVAASDPELVGYPSEDLKRLANNRSISNTVSFFPRAWWRITSNLETYGGVLFAFSEVSQIDPKNARLAGGVNRNSFDASPGGYLGTEYDVGLRFTPKLGSLNLNIGAEYGHFVFGDAFNSEDRAAPSPINAARLYVRSSL
jgi:hypothetical protein